MNTNELMLHRQLLRTEMERDALKARVAELEARESVYRTLPVSARVELTSDFWDGQWSARLIDHRPDEHYQAHGCSTPWEAVRAVVAMQQSADIGLPERDFIHG